MTDVAEIQDRINFKDGIGIIALVRTRDGNDTIVYILNLTLCLQISGLYFYITIRLYIYLFIR